MSKVISENLLAGIVFGDIENNEYIYLPGGEVGSDNPICVLERNGSSEDIALEEASEMVLYLALKPAKHPILGKRSY
ncbi:MAG: hypothetical protein MJ050_07620 [Phascolarctobacterium sp.]|nr:hypothetical protein [Phascolarctobacterium sp.]